MNAANCVLVAFLLALSTYVYNKLADIKDGDSNQNRSFFINAHSESIVLSVIVPAYNEALRLPKMLSLTLSYLNENFKAKYEVIVVDDGSTDQTSQIVKNAMESSEDPISLFRFERNRGKGAAVKAGIKLMKGSLALMADADAASDISDVKVLINKIHLIEMI